MKLLFSALLLSLGACRTTPKWACETPSLILSPGSKVAVISYLYYYDQVGNKSYTEAPNEIGAIIENYLLRLNYQPVDRLFINEIAKELRLETTGAINTEGISKLGRLSGAKYLFLVIVRYDQTLLKPISISTRLLETESAKVLGSSASDWNKFLKHEAQFWSQVLYRCP